MTAQQPDKLQGRSSSEVSANGARSVAVGGDASRALIVTGDNNHIVMTERSDPVIMSEAEKHDLLSAYSAWVLKTTESFRIPGLGTALPIDAAWIELQAQPSDRSTGVVKDLAAELAAYKEWERLARSDDALTAKDLLDFETRLVVIGTPGSGKSTFCQRVAHKLALEGRRVLWVRLPHVQVLTQRGMSVDQAILEVATNGFGTNSALDHAFLDKPDVLLADGLDECDPARSDMAAKIRAWAGSRPNTRLIVTTRPAGHDPAYFPGWEQAEILPLQTSAVQEYARKLLTSLLGEDRGRSETKRFSEQLSHNRVATVAARSPLLLGFLLALFVNSVKFGQFRAKLFEQMLGLMTEQSVAYRTFSTVMEPSLAWHCLELIGWDLLEHAGNAEMLAHRKVVDRVTGKIQPQSRVEGMRVTETALRYWTERGVLERLQVGGEDAYTFVHLTFGEYAAARYVAAMMPEAQERWVKAVHRQAHWRETLLLAVGAGASKSIVNTLLSVTTDDLSPDLILAAEALAESATDPALTEMVLERLVQRVTSHIPLIAYEAASVAARLAPVAPHNVVHLTQPLLFHEQPWTRLAAARLNLASGAPSLLPDEIAELLLRLDLSFISGGLGAGLSEFRTVNRGSASRTWNDLVCDAARHLSRVRPGRETAEVLRDMYHRHISANTAIKLSALTVDMGFPELVMKSKVSERLVDLFRADSSQPADDFLLDMLGEAIGGLPSPPERRKMLTLGQFLHDIKMGSFVAGAYLVLGKRHDPLAVKTVLMGLIGLLRVDLAELAADVAYARTQKRDNGLYLFTLPHGRESTEDWARVRALVLSVEDLVRALRHPSEIIANLAAYLIAGGVGGDQAREMVKDVLRNGSPQAVSVIGGFAQHIWEEDTRGILLERLEAGMTDGCEHLIEQLPKLPGEVDDRLITVLAASLGSESVPIVTAAAKALCSLGTDLAAPLTPLIRKTYTKWTESGSPCPRCGTVVKGARCPQCDPHEGAYVVISSPRAALISLLVHLKQLGVTELFSLCLDSRHDVNETAEKALTESLTGMPETIPGILRALRTDGDISSRVFQALLAVEPQLLVPHQEELLDLLSAPVPRVRYLLIRDLATAHWLPLQTASAAATKALDDNEPSIRDRAVLTIRTLRQRGG